MKILFVINQIAEWRGDSGLVWYSANQLKERGHEVAIVTTDGNPSKNKNEDKDYLEILKKLKNSNGQRIDIKGIPVYAAHCTIEKFGMYAPNAKKIANKIAKNYDIIHIYSWYHHIGIEFFKISKKFSIPLVVSTMGTLQEGAKNFYKKQKLIVDFFYTKKMLIHANALHSVGESEKQSYLKYGVKDEKIHQIENGINLNDFELNIKCDILERVGITKKPYILFLSRIDKKKGLEILLHAFKMLNSVNKKINLVVAGTGNPDYIQEIKNLVNELDIQDWIIFTGLVTHDEKITLFKSAKLFSLTSISDIHPRAIQEALTMGVPVVISKESDYPEVEEYNAGIIVNLDSKEICHAFEKLLKNDEILNTFSNNAKKLIKEKFLLEEQVKKFEKLYQNILLKNNQV